jgi:hypothetical protein
MRAVLVLFAFVVYANAQANRDCASFRWTNPNPSYRYPAEHGDYGNCGGATIPDATSCSIACDNNGVNSWSVVGTPYYCSNTVLSGGPQSCYFNEYEYGKRNCTVSSWPSASSTACTTNCGGGTQTFTRTITSYGEQGGEPCPRLAITVPCGNRFCGGSIDQEGYYHWGPFCASSTPRQISYTVSTSQDIDLYIFDQLDFNRYTWDAALATPQNAYYSPVNAYLTTHFESDSFTVPPGKCYHLVLDNTGVGPTNGNNGIFTNVGVSFALKGTNPTDGFSSYYYQTGFYQPASAVRTSSLSFFAAFLAVIVMLMLKLD